MTHKDCYSPNQKSDAYRWLIGSALVFTGLFFLPACRSMPVGWGGHYKVLHATSKSITIEFDTLVSSYEEILGVAQAHCESNRKDAVPLGGENSSRIDGMVKAFTFRCE